MNPANSSRKNPRAKVVVSSLGIWVLLVGTSPFTAATQLNRPAPGFALKNSNQTSRSLADYKGKVVFINFWASWCAPCHQELPELNQLARHYKGKPVRVVAINVDEDRKAAQRTLAKLNLQNASFEILWDPRSKAVSAYNVATMPGSFILDQRGIVRAIHEGFRSGDPAQWREEIDALLKH